MEERMGRILVYGCGGHARSIVDVIRETCRETEIILVDDHAEKDEVILGCRTLKKCEPKAGDRYIVALGDNEQRAKVYQMLLDIRQGSPATVVSKHAYIGMESFIGQGTFVAVGAHIGPQACVGDNSIINTGSIVEHEVKIGNNTHIAPRTVVCGRTDIGDYVFCGAGSVIIDKIRICNNVVIGAGAVVRESILEPGIYAGVPARKISR